MKNPNLPSCPVCQNNYSPLNICINSFCEICGSINFGADNYYWKFETENDLKIKFFNWGEMRIGYYLAHYTNNNLYIFKYKGLYMGPILRPKTPIYSQENLNTLNVDSIKKIFTKVAKLNQFI